MQTNNMISYLGFTYLSWLIVLYPILNTTFAMEKGANGTDAANFSCAVYAYTFKEPSMNCSWNAGKTAPYDTQYFLYLKYHKKEEMECPHYIRNQLGRHIGCYFPSVTVDASKVILTVNGSSKESPIKKQSVKVLLYQMEKIGPPQNITVTCKEMQNCTVRWKDPPTSRNVHDTCLNYQIKDEIRNTVDNVNPGTTSKNYSNSVRYKLRIRTVNTSSCPVATEFGEWSEPIEFGTDPPSFHLMNLILAVLVTALGILLLFCIWKRCHAWQNLHVPIPQPKDLYLQCEKNVGKAWMDLISTAVPNENITVVEEVTTSCKKYGPVP